jgi:hypothetical protein
MNEALNICVGYKMRCLAMVDDIGRMISNVWAVNQIYHDNIYLSFVAISSPDGITVSHKTISIFPDLVTVMTRLCRMTHLAPMQSQPTIFEDDVSY